MLFVSLPFLVNAAREAFSGVDLELERMAEVEGASRWQVFVYVTLPLAWRGILGGAVMMWGRGISEFGAVVILAYYPKIVPVLVYERFIGFGLDAAQPVALLLIVASLIVFLLLQILLVPRGKRPAEKDRRSDI
jgi:molybdate/tungstate transport system permease protein